MKKSEHTVAGVYLITCIKSDKTYVGRSINVQKRWTNHRWHLARGSHRNHHLQRAWDKHGADAFAFSIMETVAGIDREEIEAALQIAEVNALRQFPKSYNLMEAGEPAMVASDETRAKLSARKIETWSDPEYRERLSASHRAKHEDVEFSTRRAASIKAAKNEPEAREKVRLQSNAFWAPGGILRETQHEVRKNLWLDPAYRAQQKASREASWADPEAKARRGAAIRAGWARRRAAKKTPPE